MKNGEPLHRALRWAAVGELSSRVAHESNNLLAGILGQAELGLLSHDPARMKSSLESIVRSSRELKAVTERLLGFTKLMEESHQASNLLEIFRTLFGMLERAFTKAGVKVERRFEDLPMTWCDPGGAVPPLLFALRFALESSRVAGGGSLILEAAREDGDLVFRVRVTPPDGTLMETPPEKTGDLTLREADEFARQEEGSVSLDRWGAGWVVSCRFAIKHAPSSELALQETSAGAAAEAGWAEHVRRPRPLVALVVEDELPIRELIQEVLEGVDCQVDAEADAAAALRAFSRRRFDVVFTDISMPGMDGVTLVRRLCALDPKALIVVVTGRATDEAVLGALSAGARLVLRKPFELSDLRSVVQSIRQDPSGEALREVARDFGSLLVS